MGFEQFRSKFEKKKVEELPNLVAISPIVSICIVTYNHKNYLNECLSGVLAQKTSFPIEILLGDDASTDGTRAICIEYAKKYPDKIRLFLHHRENNIKINNSPTGRFNFIYNLFSAKGKYIALCEGDDYWTDPYKLQKQVDFLEANPNFNICFTRTDMLINNELELHPIPDISVDGVYTYDDLLAHNNFMATASVVFRKNFTVVPDWFYQLPSGDMGLYLITCKTAKIKCLADKTTVYRIHEQGIWSGISKIKKLENYLLFYQTIYAVLSSSQKIIVLEKHKKLIEKISYLTYSTNGLLRVLNRIQLNLKYPLK